MPSSRAGIFTDVPDGRRRIMRSIRSTETLPERQVRSLLHGLGYRFRKNLRDLPGRPDITFPRKRRIVFVHGCFWHGHWGCANGGKPRTRADYWTAKLKATAARDKRHLAALAAAGWRATVVWECELGDTRAVTRKLKRFLGAPMTASSKPGSSSGE